MERLLSKRRSSKTLSGKLPRCLVSALSASASICLGKSQEKLFVIKFCANPDWLFFHFCTLDFICVVSAWSLRLAASRITHLCILAAGLGFKGICISRFFVYCTFLFLNYKWQGVRGPFTLQCNTMGNQQNCEDSGLYFIYITPSVTSNFLLQSTAGLHTQSIKIASNNEPIVVHACDYVPIILLPVILSMRKWDIVLSCPVSR